MKYLDKFRTSVIASVPAWRSRNLYGLLRRARNDRGMLGFTFFEILLVISIATAITAAGIVGLSRLQTIFKLRGAADEVTSQLQLGRELAIANKDQVSYQMTLTSGILTLRGGVTEIARFQTPPGVNYAPSMFTWGFTPLTGSLTGCSLPCKLTLTSGDETEIVTIQANGIVN